MRGFKRCKKNVGQFRVFQDSVDNYSLSLEIMGIDRVSKHLQLFLEIGAALLALARPGLRTNGEQSTLDSVGQDPSL